MARKREVLPPTAPLFLLVTVKEWLKSVLNYRSYPKNKTGYPFFWTTLYIPTIWRLLIGHPC